jgi:hypothetical protein
MSPLNAKADFHHSIVVRDPFLQTLLECRDLLQFTLALQAEVMESHSEFDEALWQLHQTTDISRKSRR